MSDFKADEMLTFEINNKQEEIFYEDIDQPCNIRGAYFLAYDSKSNVEFYIESPDRKVLYRR